MLALIGLVYDPSHVFLSIQVFVFFIVLKCSSTLVSKSLFYRKYKKEDDNEGKYFESGPHNILYSSKWYIVSQTDAHNKKKFVWIETWTLNLSLLVQASTKAISLSIDSAAFADIYDLHF